MIHYTFLCTAKLGMAKVKVVRCNVVLGMIHCTCFCTAARDGQGDGSTVQGAVDPRGWASWQDDWSVPGGGRGHSYTERRGAGGLPRTRL